MQRCSRVARIKCQLGQIQQHLGFTLTVSIRCRKSGPPVPQRVGKRSASCRDHHLPMLGEPDQIGVAPASGDSRRFLEVTGRCREIPTHLRQNSETDGGPRYQFRFRGHSTKLRNAFVEQLGDIGSICLARRTRALGLAERFGFHELAHHLTTLQADLERRMTPAKCAAPTLVAVGAQGEEILQYIEQLEGELLTATAG